VFFATARRSYTGEDLAEIVVPGSPVVVEYALARLRDAGAAAAGPGAFTRQALANGRLSLDRAEALLRLSQAGDAAAAGRALAGLRGRLGEAIANLRRDLTALRAAVEADLDFGDEQDLAICPSDVLRDRATALLTELAAWRRAATAHGGEPLVCLAGPPNAGKSALFTRLTGTPALVSPVPGTTRDWLEAPLAIAGRHLRLLDTAGFPPGMTGGLEERAAARGRTRLDEATLVLCLSAPDARLPADPATALGIPADRCIIVATKTDLDLPADPRAAVAVSAATGSGLAALTQLVDRYTAGSPDAEPRQQALLIAASGRLAAVRDRPVPDERTAEELRVTDEHLADLVGAATPDAVLNRIFAEFCIGK
jgi:tRNA modification GTPase